MEQSPIRIPESFFRELWERNYFHQLPLQTVEGKKIEILDVGKPNSDSGPDFLNAKIIIGGITFVGDVEFHLTSKDWNLHRHNNDTRYNKIILHISAFDEEETAIPLTKSKRKLPALSLKQFLPQIIEEFEKKFTRKKIKCHGINDAVPREKLVAWVEKLSLERLELKIRRFSERLKILTEEKIVAVQEPLNRYGVIVDEGLPEEIPNLSPPFSKKDFRKKNIWEQLLYEGIFEALGYAKNQTPFLKLAQSVRLETLKQLLPAPQEMEKEPVTLAAFIESIFFSAGNFFPKDSTDGEEKEYAKECNNIWNQYKQYFPRSVFDETDWQFFRLHPDNFPTIRLAGGCRVAAKFLAQNFLKSIVGIFKNQSLADKQKLRELESLFIIRAEGFWKTHYRFGKKSSAPVTTFIGKERADEILLNVIFPLCLLYARIFTDALLRKEILSVYRVLRSSSTNSVTRLMQEQLAGTTLKLNTAMLQQGAIQLYKYYCTDERCNECAVGNIVFKNKK